MMEDSLGGQCGTGRAFTVPRMEGLVRDGEVGDLPVIGRVQGQLAMTARIAELRADAIQGPAGITTEQQRAVALLKLFAEELDDRGNSLTKPNLEGIQDHAHQAERGGELAGLPFLQPLDLVTRAAL